MVGNWKMNPESVLEAKKIAGDIKRNTRNVKKTQVVICPPFVYLPPLSGLICTTLFLGAQNAFHESLGSFTGEVSFSQLPQFKTSFVIVGHSERRMRGETDEMINKKVRSVVGDGMTVILCLGETIRDGHGDYLELIKHQLTTGLKDISKKLIDHVVIAYEPVWAIGAKEAMAPRDVHEVAIFIKKILRDMFGPLSDSVRVLYGGSVNEFNCKEIISGNFVHGFLVGRESLKPKNFVEIVKLTDEN